jgi:anti-anti-sigma factor
MVSAGKYDTIGIDGSSMIAVHNTNLPADRVDRLAADGATFASHRHGGVTTITVTGELDATNIGHFTGYVHRQLAGGRPIIVDLSRLDFLAAQGIQMLSDIDRECRQQGVDWALVSGHSTARLLRVCDTEGHLPTVGSNSEALERISPPEPMSLQLVAEPR